MEMESTTNYANFAKFHAISPALNPALLKTLNFILKIPRGSELFL